MSDKKYPRELRVKLDDATYLSLRTLADKRGESMAIVTRRILSQSLQTNSALDASDILLSTVRKAVAQELRQTENRLANICAKSAIASASTENLVTYILKNKNEPNLKMIRDAARKRGVAYIREPLEQIMQAYSEESDT
ncbi:Uncharacterized [Syntrophomonas zehnderi OL-4]|uniref:Uncharacterized n=1 Tax=Syntrophomonas zehnderi OL-4 TaxID=690567 RepID=A0A0E3W2S2_9FIRM|nr:hypothetical protein [Syntrophomonas zehnderi]CFX16476.1 Uncharacterized [Syntrophomonas zehnderi OL-4]